jgi:hypothetical protein
MIAAIQGEKPAMQTLQSSACQNEEKTCLPVLWNPSTREPLVAFAPIMRHSLVHDLVVLVRSVSLFRSERFFLVSPCSNGPVRLMREDYAVSKFEEKASGHVLFGVVLCTFPEKFFCQTVFKYWPKDPNWICSVLPDEEIASIRFFLPRALYSSENNLFRFLWDIFCLLPERSRQAAEFLVSRRNPSVIEASLRVTLSAFQDLVECVVGDDNLSNDLWRTAVASFSFSVRPATKVCRHDGACFNHVLQRCRDKYGVTYIHNQKQRDSTGELYTKETALAEKILRGTCPKHVHFLCKDACCLQWVNEKEAYGTELTEKGEMRISRSAVKCLLLPIHSEGHCTAEMSLLSDCDWKIAVEEMDRSTWDTIWMHYGNWMTSGPMSHAHIHVSSFVKYLEGRNNWMSSDRGDFLVNT